MMLCLADYERAARRRLPAAIHGFIEGGSEDEQSLRGNREAFEAIRLVPRVLVDTSARSTGVELWGERWAAPFGIAPMGAVGVAALQGDLALAGAAADAGIPYVLSSASLVTMERIVQANPRTWFQIYPSSERARNDRLLERVAGCGIGTLVVTVDVPVSGNREENTRRGYSSPLRPTPRMVADALGHPRWLCGAFLRGLLREGMPHFENMAEDRVPMFAWRTARRLHRRDDLAWDDLRRLRDRWTGRLVVKGVLSPQDACRAQACGADAVIVSNHGGRQLDGAWAPVAALPHVARAASAPLFVDGGVRRGTDVVKALAMGARLAFLGRPFLYAAAVGGREGVLHAIGLLKTELLRDMALLGVADAASIGPQCTTVAIPDPHYSRSLHGND